MRARSADAFEAQVPRSHQRCLCLQVAFPGNVLRGAPPKDVKLMTCKGTSEVSPASLSSSALLKSP